MDDSPRPAPDAAAISRHALVLLSGGQDSTVCLAWALARFDHVETVGFDYGQRHAIELVQRQVVLARMREVFPAWASRLGSDRVLDLRVLAQIGETAMTGDREIEMLANGLPSTFVPGRNLLFLSLAGALAYRRAMDVLVGGMCETDFSGYPDCRDETIQAQQTTLSLGLGQRMTIETPLMWLDKAATWALAAQLGGEALVELIVEDTHTCYLGERGTRHAWGYGCGECPACKLRQRGYAAWRAGTPAWA